MTAPGADSGENPRGNADQPWADAGAPTPDQGGWPYPSGFESYPPAPGYPPPGFPPAGFPPPPPTGGFPPPPTGGYPPPNGGYPPPGAGAPAEYPGLGAPGFPPGPGYPPPGYGPPPPGYPSAGYGTPYPGSYFNPGQAQKTNVLAVTSLVLGLLGLVFWPLALAGVIVGVVAMNQIKSTGEAGHGLAVAGTAVGGLAVTLAFILAMVALH